MNHESEIFEDEPLNFEMVYNRYNLFAKQNSSIHSVQRPVIVKAFEHIKVSSLTISKKITSKLKNFLYEEAKRL